MSSKIFCDICGAEITSIDRGVRLDDPVGATLGGHCWDDICPKCYKSLYEYIESLKKS